MHGAVIKNLYPVSGSELNVQEQNPIYRDSLFLIKELTRWNEVNGEAG